MVIWPAMTVYLGTINMVLNILIFIYINIYLNIQPKYQRGTTGSESMPNVPQDWQRQKWIGSGDGTTQLQMPVNEVFISSFLLINNFVDIEVFMAEKAEITF